MVLTLDRVEVTKSEHVLSADASEPGSYDYLVCGLWVRSNVFFPLASPPLLTESSPDVEFTLKPAGLPATSLFPVESVLGSIRNGAGIPSITVSRVEKGYLLDCKNGSKAARFFLSGDCRKIECYPEDGMTRQDIECWLFGLVLAFVLQKRGIFSLHASAVALNRRAICFLGKNGYGKSTLAYFFLQKGHALVTDDLLAFVRKTDAFHVLPACPSMNLWDTTLSRLAGTDGNSADEMTSTVKGRHSMASLNGLFCDSDVRLKGIYLLNPHRDKEDTEVRIFPVAPSKALFELIGFTRANSMIELGNQKELFLTYASLVSEVPVRSLVYPSGFDFLPAIYDAVLHDMAC